MASVSSVGFFFSWWNNKPSPMLGVCVCVCRCTWWQWWTPSRSPQGQTMSHTSIEKQQLIEIAGPLQRQYRCYVTTDQNTPLQNLCVCMCVSGLRAPSCMSPSLFFFFLFNHLLPSRFFTIPAMCDWITRDLLWSDSDGPACSELLFLLRPSSLWIRVR